MTQTALRIATEADAPRLLKLLHAAYSELPPGVLFTVCLLYTSDAADE